MSEVEVDKTLARILAVDWQYDPSQQAVHVRLLKEHFRRVVEWTKALDAKPMFYMGDLAGFIDPEIRAAPEKVAALRSHLVDKTWPSFVRMLEYTLHWAALKDTPEIESYRSLPDPFEPILVLYERGGTVTIDRKTGDYLLSMTGSGPVVAQQHWWRWNRRKPFIWLDTIDAE